MRALFIVNDPTLFDPRSAARARLRRYADALGTLHVLSCAGADVVSVVDGPLVLHAGRGSKFRSVFTFVDRARRLVRAHGIDVISAQDPFEHGWVALSAARGTPARVHVQADLLSPQFARASWFHRTRVQLALRRVLPRADRIRVVSARVKRSLDPTGTDARVSRPIPVRVTSAPAAAALPPHDFSFVCLAIGRLASEKRYADLFAAVARVRARCPRIGLFVAGDGPLRVRLARLVTALRLDDTVVFLGHRADARRLLSSAHAFVQASAYEGYGLTLVEAALAGTPIVSTDVGIVGDVLRPERDALACAAGDVAGFAARLSRMIDDDRLRRALAASARVVVDAHLASLGDEAESIADDLQAAARRSHRV